jgi:heptosyltransferase-2
MPTSATRGAAARPRVLILKLAALGDVVMASTLVERVRTRWPDAHLVWVTGQGAVPLVRRFAGVDEVRAVDDHALLAGRGLARARAGFGALRTIGRGPYDLAVVAHTDPRYERLLLGARVRERRVFRPTTADGLPPRDVWAGAEYARLVDGAATSAPQLAQLRWPGGAPPRARAREVLLAPGGARNVLRDDPLRRWPAAEWGALAAALLAEGCRVTVVGGPRDRGEGDVVRTAAPGVHDAIGTDDLDALLERLARADALVTHDSGLLHLAQLTRTPTVALFGPTRPLERIAPGAVVTVRSSAAGLACAPCYDGRDYAVCAENRCLTRVRVADVAGAVLDHLR